MSFINELLAEKEKQTVRDRLVESQQGELAFMTNLDKVEMMMDRLSKILATDGPFERAAKAMGGDVGHLKAARKALSDLEDHVQLVESSVSDAGQDE
jgi:hypothetical protein